MRDLTLPGVSFIAAVAICTLAGIGLVAGPAQAQTIDPSVSVGAPLPVLSAGPPTTVGALSATPDYVAYGPAGPAGGNQPSVQIRSTTDGSLAANVPVTSQDPAQQPYVSDDLLITPTTDADSGVTTVIASQVGSSTPLWSIQVPLSEHVVYAGAQGVLTTFTSGDFGNGLNLYRPGQDAPEAIPGVTLYPSAPSVQGSDGTIVLLEVQGSLWQVNLVNLTGSELAQTDSGTRAVLTPHRVYLVSPDGDQTRIAWQGHDGSAPSSIDIPGSDLGPLHGVGDQLVVEHSTAGPGSDLDPVDLTDGTLGAPLAQHVLATAATGDGELALVLADTSTGRIAMLADGQSPRTLTSFPVVGTPIAGGLLSGPSVAAEFVPAPGSSTGSVGVAGATASGTWVQRQTVSTSDVPALAGLSRDEVLARTSGDGSGVSSYRLSWTGGSRVLATYGAAVLSRGGRYVARVASAATASSVRIEDARTGGLRATVSSAATWSIDGSTLWTGPTSSGVLTATDLTGASAARHVSTGVTCAASSLQVVGQWALVGCGSNAWAVDLTGATAPWQLPTSAVDRSIQLGNGFLIWIHPMPGLDGEPDYHVVVAAALGGAHPTRSFGPVYEGVAPPPLAFAAVHAKSRTITAHLVSGPPASDIALDESGGARFVYVDTSQQLRLVDVSALLRLTRGPLPVRGGSRPAAPPHASYFPHH